MLSSEELDDLVRRLSARGFSAAIEQRAQLVLLLSTHSSRFAAPDRLRQAAQLIGPVICNTPDEQRRSAEIFAEWRAHWERLISLAESLPMARPDPVENPHHGNRRVPHSGPEASPLPSKWMSIFACLALLVTLLVMAFNVDSIKVRRPLVHRQWTVPDQLVGAPGARTQRGAGIRSNDGTGVLRLFGLLAPFVMFAIWLHWRLWSRRRVVGRFPTAQDPGLNRFVARGDAVDLLFPHQGLAALVHFRRWRFRAARGIDIDRSIDRTAREGGRPVLVARAEEQQRAYVALIEVRGMEDHGARFARLLVQLLRERDLVVDVFLFQGTPQSLSEEDGGTDPVGLEAVTRRYSHACFLLFFDADICCHPFQDTLLPWFSELLDRHPCALLSLSACPAGSLDRGQRLVAEARCPVMPRCVRGLSEVPARLEHPNLRAGSVGLSGDPVHPGLDEYYFDPNWVGKSEVLTRYLQDRFDRGTLLWLGALAIFPEVSFDLSVYLGANLCDDESQPLLTEQRLVTIARVRWFREGYIPAQARECLIAQMSKRHQKRVRHLLYQVVGAVLLDRPTVEPVSGTPDQQTRDMVKAFVRTRAAGDPMVDRVFTRFLLRPWLPRSRFAWPEKLARLLGFRVDAVPLVFFFLALGSGAALGWLVDYTEHHLPSFNAWVAGHTMWVGAVLYVVTIVAWSGFWTSVMLSPKFEAFTSELWRRRIRMDDIHPPR